RGVAVGAVRHRPGSREVQALLVARDARGSEGDCRSARVRAGRADRVRAVHARDVRADPPLDEHVGPVHARAGAAGSRLRGGGAGLVTEPRVVDLRNGLSQEFLAGLQGSERVLLATKSVDTAVFGYWIDDELTIGLISSAV